MWTSKLTFIYLMLVYPLQIHARMSIFKKCVKTDSELRLAVKLAPKGKSTNIILCDTVSVSSQRDPVSKMTGINVTNKVINLSCKLPSNKRCNLDGAYNSRIFYGSNAKLSVVKINFVKASTSNDCGLCVKNGGALHLTGKSSLILDRSSFMNNTAGGSGGAIHIEESSLVIKGGIAKSDASIFSDNSAYEAGAISARLSTILAETGITIFKNNKADSLSGAVNFEESQVSLKDVNFYQNVAEYRSAAGIIDSVIWLENVVFVNNTHDYDGAIFISRSDAYLKTVSFVNNTSKMIWGAAMHVFDDSEVTLTNCVFNNNVIPNTESGSNIYINEDSSPTPYVSCLSNNNVFCAGLGSDSIFGTAGGIQSTNCMTQGIAGKPGQGSCV